MGLTSALGTVLSGLQTAQAGLQLVAANVANANTPGYTRKDAQLQPILAGGTVTGVRVADVSRTIDSYVQTQLRTESSGLSYAQTNANYLNRLVQLFGSPGDGNALDTLVGNFGNALDQLATSPDSTVAQSSVLSSAQTLAQSLNTLSSGVQSLRVQANSDLSSAADQVNATLQNLASLQPKIAAAAGSGSSGTAANLLDQQDVAINQLSSLIDIKVMGGDGTAPLTITTTSGIPLFQGGTAAKLTFTGSSNVQAASRYDPDPSKSTLGTISIKDATGIVSDLLGPNGAQSGTIKALAGLRDGSVVQAQVQLDALAAGVATALVSTTVTNDGSSGSFTADLSALQPGNTLTVNYTDGSGNPQSMTFVRVDSAASLPVDPDAVPGKSPVVGIDFSGGFASATAQMQTALGGTLGLSLAGATLTVAGGTGSVTSLACEVSATATQGQGTSALPFFVDTGGAPYTGSLDGEGEQVGYATRIAVNQQLLADPSLLVKSAATTASGDATRPAALRDALEDSSQQWPAGTGIGSPGSPFSGAATDFAQQILNKQGGAALNAQNVASGQQVVVSTLQDAMNQTSGVNIDDEMEKLIQLQTTYSANARVVTTINQMLQSLMTMGMG
jgi:flagellar hook-associated protein 1 FlgK